MRTLALLNTTATLTRKEKTVKKIILVSTMSVLLAGAAYAEQASQTKPMTTGEKCAAIQAGATGHSHALVELCAWIGQYR